MLNHVTKYASGVVKTAGAVIGSVTGRNSPREEAAQKAAATREKNAAQRSASAKQAAQTRKKKSQARSAAAKRAATTRNRRKARVDAMVDATKTD